MACGRTVFGIKKTIKDVVEDFETELEYFNKFKDSYQNGEIETDEIVDECVFQITMLYKILGDFIKLEADK